MEGDVELIEVHALQLTGDGSTVVSKEVYIFLWSSSVVAAALAWVEDLSHWSLLGASGYQSFIYESRLANIQRCNPSQQVITRPCLYQSSRKRLYPCARLKN